MILALYIWLFGYALLAVLALLVKVNTPISQHRVPPIMFVGLLAWPVFIVVTLGLMAVERVRR